MTECGHEGDVSDFLKRAVANDTGIDAVLIDLDHAGMGDGFTQALKEYAQASLQRFLQKRLTAKDAVLLTGEGVALIFENVKRDGGANRDWLQSSINTLLAGDPRLQGSRANVRAFHLTPVVTAPHSASAPCNHALSVSFAPVWSVAHEYAARQPRQHQGGVSRSAAADRITDAPSGAAPNQTRFCSLT